MALKLMYITNRQDVAQVAQKAGVDRIFVDMEYIGKSLRQGGMDTVQSHHTVEDVRAIRQVLTSSELLVRCNPIHEASAQYCSSAEEIDQVIAAGADVIMLPYFKSIEEVSAFLQMVGGRVRTCLLMETPEAAALAEEILSLPGIDEVHIGLNDMSLGYGKKFMFELLSDGTVETLCQACARHGIVYGFGGIATLGKGALPAEYVIREHYRLGSTRAILSRSFCNADLVGDIDEIAGIFASGMKSIRQLEEECASADAGYFADNRKYVVAAIKNIVAGILEKQQK